MNVVTILLYMFPNSRPVDDWIVSVDDDGNQKIVAWFLPDPQPDEATLEANEAPALAAIDLAQKQSAAQDALSASDITVLRLIELNSTFVPADWKAYRTALRAVVNATPADGPQTLPVRPAYPAPGA